MLFNHLLALGAGCFAYFACQHAFNRFDIAMDTAFGLWRWREYCGFAIAVLVTISLVYYRSFSGFLYVLGANVGLMGGLPLQVAMPVTIAVAVGILPQRLRYLAWLVGANVAFAGLLALLMSYAAPERLLSANLAALLLMLVWVFPLFLLLMMPRSKLGTRNCEPISADIQTMGSHEDRGLNKWSSGDFVLKMSFAFTGTVICVGVPIVLRDLAPDLVSSAAHSDASSLTRDLARLCIETWLFWLVLPGVIAIVDGISWRKSICCIRRLIRRIPLRTAKAHRRLLFIRSLRAGVVITFYTMLDLFLGLILLGFLLCTIVSIIGMFNAVAEVVGGRDVITLFDNGELVADAGVLVLLIAGVAVVPTILHVAVILLMLVLVGFCVMSRREHPNRDDKVNQSHLWEMLGLAKVSRFFKLVLLSVVTLAVLKHFALPQSIVLVWTNMRGDVASIAKQFYQAGYEQAGLAPFIIVTFVLIAAVWLLARLVEKPQPGAK